MTRPLATVRTLARLLLLLCIAAAANAHAQQGSRRALLWEVASQTTTVYLLGTVHVGSPSLYPLPPAVEHAFARSTVIALEADPQDPAAMLGAMGATMYTPPETLAQNIPPPLYAQVRDAFAGAGLPEQAVQSMRPFMAALVLTMLEAARLGLDPALGIDVHLATRARREGKRLVTLESIGMQLALLDGMSRDTQVAMLRNAVDGMRSGALGRDMTAMVDAWRAGDAERLDEIATRDLEQLPPAAARALRETLYDQRNRDMTDAIAAMLAGREIVLVAVGAGHLTGTAGILRLLEARGFTVRRL
jgi:uncharacterized protein YbaP (TraB family)